MYPAEYIHSYMDLGFSVVQQNFITYSVGMVFKLIPEQAILFVELLQIAALLKSSGLIVTALANRSKKLTLKPCEFT